MTQDIAEQIGVGESATLTEHEIVGRHITIVRDFDLVSTIAENLRAKRWILFSNQTSLPFWTSDCPVLRLHEQGGANDIDYQLERPGLRIILPLDPASAILLCDLDDDLNNFGDNLGLLKKLLPCTMVYDIEVIKVINAWHVYWSDRVLLSSFNDFSLVQRVLEQRPDFKDRTQSRVEIELHVVPD